MVDFLDGGGFQQLKLQFRFSSCTVLMEIKEMDEVLEMLMLFCRWFRSGFEVKDEKEMWGDYVVLVVLRKRMGSDSGWMLLNALEVVVLL
ncbi:hypothetical protein C5167_041723 [Papaver somniferum]|nr:hypothetical protein C5167_041723 [Papaver somniferum]